MAYDADDLLRDFAEHGICCDQEGRDGWVDDSAEPILKALLAAGWTPPDLGA